MRTEISSPKIVVRVSNSPADIRAVQFFRRGGFGNAERQQQLDADAFDDRFQHILAEDLETGAIVGCVRVSEFLDGTQLNNSYSHQFYDLSGLQQYTNVILELGRFCVAPGRYAADTIRLIWAMVTRIVDRNGAKLLIGCSSFRGVDPKVYGDAFGYLGAGHVGPRDWVPGVKSDPVVWLPEGDQNRQAGGNLSRRLPTLLRSYLGMGGWVSDHGVIDHELQTIHVFTGLEVDKIPSRRAERLRRLAA